MTEMLAYTLAGVLLYFGSDWVLRYAEQQRGKPFADRNLIFFGIILVLALTSFSIIRIILAN